MRARTERRLITVHRVKIPQACVRNSRLQYQVTLHISGLRACRHSIRSADMTAIHSQATHAGWCRVSHWPRRGNHLIQRALAAVRDWRRRLQDRNRSSTLDERTLRNSEICRGDTFYLDSTQRERDAWLDTLHFPPFCTACHI